ncbi:MAG: ferrous iron transport protein A [bacterium]|nr:ferrous iron transport protein A [bacterium]
MPLGSRCRLVEIEEPSDNLLRLMEMGLVPGTSVVIERTAPLNSPYSLRLPGCTLAVRREDAKHLVVAPLPTRPNDPVRETCCLHADAHTSACCYCGQPELR